MQAKRLKNKIQKYLYIFEKESFKLSSTTIIIIIVIAWEREHRTVEMAMHDTCEKFFFQFSLLVVRIVHTLSIFLSLSQMPSYCGLLFTFFTHFTKMYNRNLNSCKFKWITFLFGNLQLRLLSVMFILHPISTAPSLIFILLPLIANVINFYQLTVKTCQIFQRLNMWSDHDALLHWHVWVGRLFTLISSRKSPLYDDVYTCAW